MCSYKVDWLEVARRRLCISSFNKRVFKLDRNFHVYAHGDLNKLQVERDTNGTFLKLYFDIIK